MWKHLLPCWLRDFFSCNVDSVTSWLLVVQGDIHSLSCRRLIQQRLEILEFFVHLGKLSLQLRDSGLML